MDSLQPGSSPLKKIFADYKDKFEIIVVEDITKEGAFDEAVKGVDTIEHTVSPFHFKADDPQELIGPAINGTRSILKSALNKSSIRRIIVTSSTAAIISSLSEPKVFSELDWNEQAIEEVKKQGKNASQAAKYRASKTLAEKAAWEFYKASNTNRSCDLVILNPPYVFGPVIHNVSSPSVIKYAAPIIFLFSPSRRLYLYDTSSHHCQPPSITDLLMTDPPDPPSLSIGFRHLPCP
ncbi:hypothetical protein F5051DRAFT_447097 [Lentinula edodes]|nr:hypothetical protein F5051DRAFT_447097 [Lentinula edodes]